MLVMENVFYERVLAPVYDLKGSSRARLSADDPADPASVLLDENLKQSSRSAPLLVRSPWLSELSESPRSYMSMLVDGCVRARPCQRAEERQT